MSMLTEKNESTRYEGFVGCAQRNSTGHWVGVREKRDGKESEKENEREALFRVVKGGTGLSRFFSRTGKLLIFLGRGRVERMRKKNAGTRRRRDGRSLH